MEMENEKKKKKLTLPLLSLSAATQRRTDMVNQNENENEMNLTLPSELIIEILLRLPVRSLLRFKCVCTSWFFLISDTHFAKSHFDFNAAPTHRLLLRFLDENDEDKVESFDLDSSLRDRSAVVTLNLPPPCMSCDRNSSYFLGSCRGFMLLAYNYHQRVIVWNPSTGFHKQILVCCEFMLGSLYGFGYDKSTDDYFLVLIGLASMTAKIQVFSAKTESWDDTKFVNVQYTDLGYFYRHGVFLNDSLHWLVISKDTSLLVVIAFDLLEKSLSEIPLPPELAAPVLTGESAPKYYHVRVLGGCLSLCYTGGTRDKVEIWVMKEYKVQSSWTRAFDCDIPCKRFYPIRFIEGGGVVGSNGNGRLVKFNGKGKLLEHHKYGQEIKNVQNYYGMCNESDYRNVQIYFEMYRESLLLFPGEQPFIRVRSLPRDFKEATKVEEATEDEEEEASGLSLHSVKSLTCDFKEAAGQVKATEEVEAAENEEVEATEVEEATDDKEEESNKDEEATEDEEEESIEDDNI